MASSSSITSASGDPGNGMDTGSRPEDISYGKQDQRVGKEAFANPTQKDPYADLTAASQRIDKLLAVSRHMRPQFERDWFRNLLFSAGVQWITEDRGRWRPRNLPSWFPRSMTNKFAEKINDLCSAILQNGRVPINYVPANKDEESKATAEISESVRDSMYEEAEVDEFDEELARWVVTMGNGFLIPYYDDDEQHGTVSMLQLQCNSCAGDSDDSGESGDIEDIGDGSHNTDSFTDQSAFQPPQSKMGTGSGASGLSGTPYNPQTKSSAKLVRPEDAQLDENGQNATCPDCNGPLSPARDQSGQPITATYPTGKFSTDVCSPFEIHIDHRVRHWNKHQRFCRMKLVDIDLAEEKYHIEKGKIVADDANTDLGMFYLESIAQITSSYGRTSALPGGITSTSSQRSPKTMEYHFFELPTEEYPDGLHAVRLGTSAELIVKCEALPDKYHGGPRDGKPFLPLVHFGFDILPGRAWAKTRMDDLISLQSFRNIIDANIRLTVQRMGNSIWLNPKGSGVAILTGTPGQKVDYNPVSFGGSSFAKPERIPPDLSGIAALVALLNKIDDAMERIAGTNFLQGGDTPPGVTAASALAYLGEKAQRSMSTFARSWAKSWKSWEEMGLEIYREHASQARITTIAGKNKEWEIEQFTKAELQGGVKMQVDYNGLFPKSQATERATIQQLQAMGAINPLDSEMNEMVLEKFGESDLKPSRSLDVTEATKENLKFMESKGTVSPQFLPLVQNAGVHITVHSDLCKGEDFKLLPPEAQQLMIKHVELHMQEQQMQQGMAQGAAAPNAGAPTPGGPAGGGPPAKPGGPQGPGGTRQVQQPRPVSPEQNSPQPDLLAAAAGPAEPEAVGAAH